ncbi:hypothetical protein [uncultured Clostridium sp.]|uniref:cucumopine synthase-related protein n=1 Tax=uncultured Clostridium sp. TaxID=59620 RepID=UPI0025FF4873|nr:hypothetical protein [uncultured Clostridium sp.]
MKKWEQLKLDIEAETMAMQDKEPEELYRIRTATVGNEAGSYDQDWTSIDFSNGMIRDFSMYTMYPIYKLAVQTNYTLENLKDAYKVFHIPYTEYLGYSGMYTLRKFCRRFRECLDEFETKEEFIEIYKSFLIYTNKLSAWSFHYFPWELGYQWKPQID